MPKMPRPIEPTLIAMSRYSREEYPKIKAIEYADNDMEETYDEWRAIADAAAMEARKMGQEVEWFDMKPADFIAWLTSTGKPNRPENRAEYVHLLASAKYATKN